MSEIFTGAIRANAVTVILLLGIVTYLCRFVGFWIVGFLHIGPRARRAFQALPGCIAMASALPVAIDAGTPAIAAVATGFVLMRFVRIEILALIAALAVVAGLRQAGF